ncbi:MAG: glycosyltransferase family 1 protein [Myxococcales bacterium]|nr:glycosyltransferase family 1 protein [Myxococcales bacterium]
MIAPWMGHLNASFHLAKSLRARGHDVTYVTVPLHADHIRAQGFEPQIVFPDLPTRRDSSESAGLASIRADLRIYNDVTRRILAGELDAVLSPRGMDVAVIDYQIAFLAMITRRANVTTAIINTTLPSSRNQEIPPVGSSIIPDESRASRASVRLAWRVFAAQRYATELVLRLAGMKNTPIGFTKKLACSTGYPASEVDLGGELAIGPKLPQLVLCPRAFDFPRSGSSDQHVYCGPCIDTQRADASFPWHELPAGRPLVYCSFGSHVARNAERGFRVGRLFRAVVELAARRPAFTFLVVTGRVVSAADFEALPDNVVLIERAPQLEVLARASLVITHGGLNTLKECIYYAVPMIVIPFLHDQPGNAARVEYHGIGLRCQRRDVSADRLVELVDRISGTPAFGERVSAMSALFRELEDREAATNHLEALLDAGARRRPP